MALIQLAPPYPVFTDKNGDPLDNGYLYFGVVDLNPETNPIQVYYDSTFTQPVAQPLRTSNGYPMRNGAPALIFAGSQFSVTVRDKNSDLVIYSPVGYGIDPGAIAGVVVVQDQTGDGVTTAFGMGASPATENATNVFIDGVYQSKAGYSISGSTLTFSEAPPLYSAIEIVSNETSIVGGTGAQLVTYNEGGIGAVNRTVQGRLQDFVTVKDFGAVGDGVADDTAAFAAAETASDFVHVPEGTYRIASNLDFDATLVGDGGVLYFENTTVNFNGVIQSAPNPLFTFGSSVLFKITTPQDVYADWFMQTGSEEFAIRRAFELSAAGSRILLLGKTYTTKSIDWSNDPLDATGKDTGKTIEGVSPAQRYKTTGEFFGTRIVLADNEDANMFTIDSVGANTFGSGAIKNVMLEGNKGNQTAGSGIEIQAVKDFLFENVFVWNFNDDGILFSGANNQINLEGFIECWNNGRDGISGGAIGDAQMSGSIRTVNNGRHGFYLAAGSGRYDQIYSYANAERGVWIGPSVTKSLFINYLRSEDNDKEGCRIDAKNVSIDYCDVPDNGVTASSGTDQAGLYLSSTAENVNIRVLTYPYRTTAVHNQLYLLYDLSLRGCTIQNMVNPAYGQHSISGEETAVFSNNSSLNGCFVDRRMTASDTYANLKDAGATITPKSDTYGRYNITDITETMTISNTTNARSCEGMVLEFAVESNGSFNLNFGSVYLDASGSAISATALTASQTAFARFQQINSNWYLISPIVVA